MEKKMNMAKIKEILPEGFKRCSKCGEVKGVGEYYNCKSNKDGKFPSCKSCGKIYDTEQRRQNENKTLKAASAKRWTDKNKEYIREKNRIWSEKNKERKREKHRKWHSENKDKQIGYTKIHNEKIISQLSDVYIRYKLLGSGFKREHITPDLIEAKRLIIKSKRVVKQKQNNESKEMD